MTPLRIFEAFGCVLGLFFGSFLNVCISRLPRGKSVVKPRSRCPQCSTPIRWYNNIPVLSWLLLRGRCRDCSQPISWRYPAVEIAMGIWFFKSAALASFLFLGDINGDAVYGFTQKASLGIDGLSFAILGFLLIGLVVMDWQTQLLPDAFTLIGIAIAFFLTCIRTFFLQGAEDQVLLDPAHQIQLSGPGSSDSPGNVFLTGPEHVLINWVAATIGAALVLLLIRWLYKAMRHREGMGLGDAKLLALIAAFLGFWPAILSLFIGTVLASLYALILLARGRANRATRLAFGSFLASGGLIAALFGDRMIAIYASFLR